MRIGCSGACIDDIADRIRSTKYMIYCCFASIRHSEQELDVEHLDPKSAIPPPAGLAFDQHEARPDFMRLVRIENIHQAEHAASPTPRSLDAAVIAITDRILCAGREQGVCTW